MAETLSIGALAKRAATSVEAIRYYEQEGLMPKPGRSGGGQRRYSKAHADRLAFIRHSRELGFPLEAIRELLNLVDQPDLSCGRVDAVAVSVLSDVETKILRLESLRQELQRMIRQCRHGRISECRIVKVLADHTHSNCLNADHKF